MMKNENKHTPGPWEFSGCDHAPILHIYAPDNKHIFHGERSQTEQEANARLIAAAPEMLEALKSASHMSRFSETEYAGRMYQHCTSCDATISEGEAHLPDCDWLKIDAAIVKAEGRL